jgi:hypothetical protein
VFSPLFRFNSGYDKLYFRTTRKNRNWLKERGIRITAVRLGRKSKQKQNQETYYQKTKGKNGYNLNQIRAKLLETSESWVACIFFVINLIHREKLTVFYSSIKMIFNEIGDNINSIERILVHFSFNPTITCLNHTQKLCSEIIEEIYRLLSQRTLFIC